MKHSLPPYPSKPTHLAANLSYPSAPTPEKPPYRHPTGRAVIFSVRWRTGNPLTKRSRRLLTYPVLHCPSIRCAHNLSTVAWRLWARVQARVQLRFSSFAARISYLRLHYPPRSCGELCGEIWGSRSRLFHNSVKR